jgi:hypothetical protein
MALLAFAAFAAFLARLAGWRPHLSPVIMETVRGRVSAGRDADDSDSDSGDSDLEKGSRSVAGGAVHVSQEGSWTDADDERDPTLGQRWTSWLDRWSTGAPMTVHETIEPGPTDRELQREALVEHLTRERERIGLSAVSIVRAASGQDDVPWGRVSESTVWRAWRELPPRDGGTQA